MTEPIQALPPVSAADLRTFPATQGPHPTGTPDAAAVNAFHAALHAPPNVDGPEVIGAATRSPGDHLVATIGRIEHDVTEWVTRLKAVSNGDELLNPQQIFAQMIRSGEMSVQLTLLTNLSKETSEGVHTLFQQQN